MHFHLHMWQVMLKNKQSPGITQQRHLSMGQLTLEPRILTPSLLWNLPALNSCKSCFPCYHIPGFLVSHFPWVIGRLIFHYREFNGFKIQSRSDQLSAHKVQNIPFLASLAEMLFEQKIWNPYCWLANGLRQDEETDKMTA